MPLATLMQVTLHDSYLPVNSSCGSDALFLGGRAAALKRGMASPRN